MALVNENYLKLTAGYLFPEIARRVRTFEADNPDSAVIRMGIGDVVRGIPRVIIDAMKAATEELAHDESFQGYPPELGQTPLRQAIVEHDFKSRGIDVDIDDVFISDGSKCDSANIQEIFGLDNVVALTDPVYPVYCDSNVMAGRTGAGDGSGRYEGIVYLPCTVDNNFLPALPDQHVDLIYLCSPNNPTGAVMTKSSLEEWVDYARKEDAIIFFDAAYEGYITDPEIPHSIYEIPGARDVAIEMRSFSKSAGFTGLRCAFTVVPQELRGMTASGNSQEIRPLWNRRISTKFNGVSYPVQAAAAAAYSDEGRKEVRGLIEFYLANAAIMQAKLTDLGYTVYGGVNAPYLWIGTPEGVDSWKFFDILLHEANVVGTPGAGFGAAGEGFLRLSAFQQRHIVDDAMARIARL